MTIDVNDTVVFDIGQAVINGNQVDIPVYFLSDDIINALDFSFKYNQANFTYDSIVDLTSYMQSLAYYNTNDSIVRFTSYSLQTYTNDTPLVMIRFIILSGQFCTADMNTIHVYLNGDACTYKLIDCIPSGITETNNSSINSINIYPNPLSNEAVITFSLNEKSHVIVNIYDITGKLVMKAADAVYNNGENRINLSSSNLEPGLYEATISVNNTVQVIKFSVQRN